MPGTFSSRRCYDQIYMSAAYAGLTVHVLGSDAGVTAAFNGGTHMPLEDAAMYLSIPETTVLDPADYDQLASITRQLVNIDKGVTYTRFVRKGIIQVYGEGSEFEIGKGVVLHESDKDQATIITSGIMVDESLKAYEALQAEGISVRVIDMFTWKPLDEELVVKAAKETGAIVTRPVPSSPPRTTTSPAAWVLLWPTACPGTPPPYRNLWACRTSSVRWVPRTS